MKIKRANTTPIYIAEAATSLPPPRWRWLKRLLVVCTILGALVVGAFYYVQHIVTPPDGFPLKTEFVIPEGATTVAITDSLFAEGYIRSPFAMYALLVLFYEPRDIKASTYIFSHPLSMHELAERLMVGDYGNDLVRFVHYEGESRTLLAKRAAEVLDGFDAEEFMKLTEGKEGRLFPDT